MTEDQTDVARNWPEPDRIRVIATGLRRDALSRPGEVVRGWIGHYRVSLLFRLPGAWSLTVYHRKRLPKRLQEYLVDAFSVPEKARIERGRKRILDRIRHYARWQWTSGEITIEVGRDRAVVTLPANT